MRDATGEIGHLLGVHGANHPDLDEGLEPTSPGVVDDRDVPLMIPVDSSLASLRDTAAGDKVTEAAISAIDARPSERR